MTLFLFKILLSRSQVLPLYILSTGTISSLSGERISYFHRSIGGTLCTNSRGGISTCCTIAMFEGVQIPPENVTVVKIRPLDLFDRNNVGILESTGQFVDVR